MALSGGSRISRRFLTLPKATGKIWTGLDIPSTMLPTSSVDIWTNSPNPLSPWTFMRDSGIPFGITRHTRPVMGTPTWRGISMSSRYICSSFGSFRHWTSGYCSISSISSPFLHPSRTRTKWQLKAWPQYSNRASFHIQPTTWLQKSTNSARMYYTFWLKTRAISFREWRNQPGPFKEGVKDWGTRRGRAKSPQKLIAERLAPRAHVNPALKEAWVLTGRALRQFMSGTSPSRPPVETAGRKSLKNIKKNFFFFFFLLLSLV